MNYEGDTMNWMDEARTIAAQCWCDDKTKHIEMDVVLAEIIAERIAAWMETAAQHHRNECYYRELLVKIGETIGDRAYICDDGSRSEDVLCAKLPEIIANDYSDPA